MGSVQHPLPAGSVETPFQGQGNGWCQWQTRAMAPQLFKVERRTPQAGGGTGIPNNGAFPARVCQMAMTQVLVHTLPILNARGRRFYDTMPFRHHTPKFAAEVLACTEHQELAPELHSVRAHVCIAWVGRCRASVPVNQVTCGILMWM